MKKSAIISDCGKYRYTLSRIWDDSKKKVMFIMLNPSIADAEKDDATIRRCIGFAKFWGYGGIEVCNLIPYRSTNPKELLEAENPLGNQSENFKYLSELSKECEKIIFAWGNRNIVKHFFKNSPFDVPNIDDSELLNFFEKIHYIELSKDGIPKHPLYLKSTLTPVKLKP